MKRRLAMAFMLFIVSFCGTWQQAFAFNPLAGPCGSGGGGSAAVCHAGSGNPLSGKNGVLLKVANIIAYIAGLAAIIVIIIGGFRMVISRGDAGAVASARTTVLYAVIGLVVIALAKTIIGYVIGKL